MDNDLKTSLKALHTRLAHSGPIDEELQDLLRQLDGDIRQLLEQRAAEGDEVSPYGLAERTQEISARFAVKHPTLEPALRELSSILANMGI